LAPIFEALHKPHQATTGALALQWVGAILISRIPRGYAYLHLTNRMGEMRTPGVGVGSDCSGRRCRADRRVTAASNANHRRFTQRAEPNTGAASNVSFWTWSKL
jgi:hypothetical protein